MLKNCFVILLLLSSTVAAFSQELKTENIILITVDGLRWQEIFEGADSSILFNTKYVKDKSVVSDFWHEDPSSRRKSLSPFLWRTIGIHGQLYGNRNFKNKMKCSNLQLFSYPGYSELLVGFVDRRVRSNDKIQNPNHTVLEMIEKQPGYNGKVAAFATWDVFPYILREEISNIYVNAGKEKVDGNISEREKLLNELEELVPNPHGSRYDVFTFYRAFEYLKRERPKVLMIGFDETDQHGHGGRYDQYLKSTHRTDEMLSRLWKWIQTDEEYKDKTTMIITTDHGRGKGKNNWKDHGILQFGSAQIWMAVIGPDTPPDGEMVTKAKILQKQIPATIAALLGMEYEHRQEVGDRINSVYWPQELASGSR